jgi:hypothetical protein
VDGHQNVTRHGGQVWQATGGAGVLALLPVHASGLNQIYFSVTQRKLLTSDDVEDLDELQAQILAFENHISPAGRMNPTS